MHFKVKEIGGRNYKYAVESFRLPNGESRKAEVLVRNQGKDALVRFLTERKEKAFTNYMLSSYKTNSLFNEIEFEKIEKIRIGYQRLIKKIPKNSLKDLLRLLIEQQKVLIQIALMLAWMEAALQNRSLHSTNLLATELQIWKNIRKLQLVYMIQEEGMVQMA